MAVTNLKILLVTTTGCETCNIARDNIREALGMTSKKVDLIVQNYDDLSKKERRDLGRIRDFPMFILYNNDSEVYRGYGKYPAIVYLRYMDIHF